ncbi:acylneuraminate cytidylyltransferase family protein [Pararhodospirillum oryzae]|uniref:Cytidylyltransferase n=1 Tax=Pararhodospirillum oryzae TaxID=478448 RepID=A0A512H9N8_9PROT|nr:cytidylyltransferase [Pararhodospirillum oryzae]GEO82176.1 hypothetical protein ROR02_23070 [Pararhodospirillum oryzae]
MIAALLLGRKGSQGFPGKNLAPLLGRPLSWYPMRAALDAPEVGGVYLSTDDEQLKTLARANGVEVIDRPPHLATNAALAEDAYVHGRDEIVRRTGQPLELLVCLFCNAPTVNPAQISEAIAALRQNPDLDSAITVSRYNMWSPLRARRIGSDGLVHPFVDFEALGDPTTFSCDRDSQGDAWFADVALTVIRPGNLDHLEEGVSPQRWMGKNIHPIYNEAGLDIDYPWQMGQLEWWLKAHGWKEA